MSKVVLDVSTSLDGFTAGPNVHQEEPTGNGGERLHKWYAGKGSDGEVDLAVGRESEGTLGPAPVHRLTDLIDGVRGAVAAQTDWAATAQLVAEQLRTHLPAPDVLTAEQRLGSPDDYRGHTLYVEPDGSFSIVALVWRPGQITRIHDHVTWCVLGVIQGAEHEELFDADLNMIGSSDNHVGEVSGFAPPGGIHRVRNNTETTAISIHIYGTDITRLGSSARRYYD